MYEEEDLRAHHVQLVQLINLQALLPHLIQCNFLSRDEVAHISSKHHSAIKKTSFLLRSIYKKGRDAISSFVRCLREEKDHQGHKEILQLLDQGPTNLQERHPLLEILHSNLDDIVKSLNFTTFLNALTNSGAIEVHSFLDLVNPDRPVCENLEKLVCVLEEKGTEGFIDFLSALRKDSSIHHAGLFKMLYGKGKFVATRIALK